MLGQYKVKGIDFSANYSHEFANADSINVRVIATKTISQYVRDDHWSPGEEYCRTNRFGERLPAGLPVLAELGRQPDRDL